METGFVKLYRKLLDNESLMHDHVLLAVFVWCLLRANWQENAALIRGQLRFKNAAAAAELGIAQTTFFRKIRKLRDLDCITLETERRHTTVTICNYGVYQDGTLDGGMQVERKRNAGGKPSLVREEIKELKNPADHKNTIRFSLGAEGEFEPTPKQIADEFERLYCGGAKLHSLRERDGLIALFAELARHYGPSLVLAGVRDPGRLRTQTPMNFDSWFVQRMASKRRSPEDEQRVIDESRKELRGESA